MVAAAAALVGALVGAAAAGGAVDPASLEDVATPVGLGAMVAPAFAGTLTSEPTQRTCHGG